MRWLRLLFSLAIVGVLVGGPWWYLRYQKNTIRNFHVVKEGVLYRSGQNSRAGLKRVFFDYGIKTVVTLRFAKNAGDDPPDLDEERFCQSAGIKFFRIPHRPWWASDGSVPAEKGLKEFLKIMNDPANHPVLVHCLAGIHRTGAFCAVYRIESEGWSNEKAIAEMRNIYYTDDHMDVQHYLENYQRSRLTAPDGPSSPVFKSYPASLQTGPSP